MTGNVDALVSLLGNLTGSADGNTAEDVLSREKGGPESGR